MTIGIILLILSSVTTCKSFLFHKESILSEGKIIRMEKTTVRRQHHSTGGVRISTSPTQKVLDIPIIQYSPEKGRLAEFKSNVSFETGKYKIGDTVPIRYMPGAPAQARIHTWAALWQLPVLLAAIGGLFTIAGIYFCRKKL